MATTASSDSSPVLKPNTPERQAVLLYWLRLDLPVEVLLPSSGWHRLSAVNKERWAAYIACGEITRESCNHDRPFRLAPGA